MGDMANYYHFAHSSAHWWEEDGEPSYWPYEREVITFKGVPPTTDCKMPFGKYKNTLISTIVQQDFNYIKWLYKIELFGLLREVVIAWMEAHEEGVRRAAGTQQDDEWRACL